MGQLDNVINVKLNFESGSLLKDVSALDKNLSTLQKSAEKAFQAFNKSGGTKGIDEMKSAEEDFRKIVEESGKAIEDERAKLDQLSADLASGKISSDEFAVMEEEIQKNIAALEQLGADAQANADKIAGSFAPVAPTIRDDFEKAFGSGVFAMWDKMTGKASEVAGTVMGLFEKVSTAPEAINTSVQVVQAGLSKLDAVFGKTADKADNLLRNTVSGAIAGIAPVVDRAGSAMQGVVKGVEAISGAMSSATAPVNEFLIHGLKHGAELGMEAVEKFGEVAVEVGKEAVASFLEIDQKIGQANNVMGNVLKDGSKGAQEFIDTIKKSPASMEAMLEGGKALAGTIDGLTGKSLYTLTKSLEDSTVALGGTSSDVEHFGLALGEMSAKSKLTAQQFNMMSNTNAAFAKKLKETTVEQSNGKLSLDEWSEAMKRGEVSSAAVIKAIGTMGKEFSGGATKVTSFNQLFGNMEQSFKAMSWEAITAGLKEMGVNVQDLSNQFTHFEEGLNIEGAVTATVDVIKELISSAEEMGSKLADGFNIGVGGAGGLDGVLKNLKSTWDSVVTIVQSFMKNMSDSKSLETFGVLLGTITNKGSELIKSVFQVLEPLINIVSKAFGSTLKYAMDGVGKLFSQIVDDAKPFLDMARNFLNQYAQPIQLALETLGKFVVSVFLTDWKMAWDVFSGTVKAGFAIIKGVFDMFGGVFDIVMSVVHMFQHLWKHDWDGFFSDFGDTWKGFVRIFDGLGSVFDGALKGVHVFVDNFMSLVGGLVDFVKGVWNSITSIFSDTGKVVGDAKASASASAGKSVDVGRLTQDINRAIDASVIVTNAIAGAKTQLEDTQQQTPSQTIINITGSKQDARAIADELRRLNII